MARIFISHSSVNNAAAVALADWLRAEGWDDLFLDLDPERGIAAGERWERALHEAAHRCEAVLFLISPAWLASAWCTREFNLARRMNKRLFGVLTEDVPLEELPPDLPAAWQMVNLASGSDHDLFRATLPDGTEAHVTFSRAGLTGLRTGLAKAGLDPRFFVWPPEDEPERAPYPGLKPLEAADAGIFFGCDAQIVQAMDMLRGLTKQAPPRLMVLLGASGAGKSSFLRAGLWPRLQRDDRTFLPLPVIRPERAVLSGERGLVGSLEAAFKAQGLARNRADIKATIDGDAPALQKLLRELAERASPPRLENDTAPLPPTIVLPVDQGEELFQSDGRAEAVRFLALLADLLKADVPKIVALITIRSDAYEQLQSATELEEVPKRPFDLPPMPRGAYKEVIEAPALRLPQARKLTIEPALTEALLGDIEAGGGKDALPLLAFTLERLYLEYGGDGDLKLAGYDQLGRIKGSIEAAVEHALKAADADPAIPRERSARLALLRRGLIPWLAGIDPDSGAPRRRVARRDEIPAEARPLINHLVEARLLATDTDPESGAVTIEPAHESLLRQWGLLEGWLEEDFAALTTLEGVRRAACDWAANDKQPAWLAHRAGRLEEAERVALRKDFAGFLKAEDLAYLEASRAAEQARLRRERRTRQIITYGARGFAAIVTVVAVVAVFQWFGAGKAEQIAASECDRARVAAKQAQIAKSDAIKQRDAALTRESRFLASVSAQKLAGGHKDAGTAIGLALEGLPDEARGPDGKKLVDRPYVPESEFSLNRALQARSEKLVLFGHGHNVTHAAFSPDGSRIITASLDYTARVWDAASGNELLKLEGHRREVHSAAFSPDGLRIVTASSDKTARVWDAESGSELLRLNGHGGTVISASFSPDGSRIVTASDDGTARIWDAASGSELLRLDGHRDRVFSAAFSPDGSRIVTASSDKTARVWDAESGKELARLDDHRDMVFSASFSPDGSRIVTTSSDKTARVWDAASGKELVRLDGHSGGVISAAFSPDGSRIVTASNEVTARIWDAATRQALVDQAKRIAPRCLTQQQRKDAFLPPEPPRWCITGAGREAETDPSKWKPLWPYHSKAWRDWLAARDRGENPPLPKTD